MNTTAIVQAVIVAVLLGVLTGAWSTYMTTHDLQRDVAELKGKVDWLYRDVGATKDE